MSFDGRSYQARRRADHRARGLCQRCSKPALVRSGKRMSRCAECLPLISGLSPYRPLDHILEKRSVRLLRALRWFDGVSAADLLDALEIDDKHDRATTAARLVQLAKVGYAECAAGLYRITQAGRQWLADQIARADVGVASDKEAA